MNKLALIFGSLMAATLFFTAPALADSLEGGPDLTTMSTWNVRQIAAYLPEVNLRVQVAERALVRAQDSLDQAQQSLLLSHGYGVEDSYALDENSAIHAQIAPYRQHLSQAKTNLSSIKEIQTLCQNSTTAINSYHWLVGCPVDPGAGLANVGIGAE